MPLAAGQNGGKDNASGIAREVERAVLKVLTGTPPSEAARETSMGPTDLAEAAAIYQRNGQHALEQQITAGWWQLYIEFTDWNTAEQTTADHIAPLLHHAENRGVITTWWFMRKYPCWRLRLQPGPAGHTMKTSLGAALDELVADGRITRWWTGIYEAETAAFGGQVGMDVAHELFCADSNAIMTLIRSPRGNLGRRELSLLLCASLLRAAGLEWYEQGDVWHRVTLERPPPTNVATSKLTAMAGDLRRLMRIDATPDGPLLRPDGPLASAAHWTGAFRQAGRTLGAAARAGTLERGLREVASYLVIFHWNRLGLPAQTQSILGWAARAAILGPALAVTTTSAGTSSTT